MLSGNSRFPLFLEAPFLSQKCIKPFPLRVERLNNLILRANDETAVTKSQLNADNLPAPDVLAAEIAENLKSALEQFNSIIEELKTK